MADHHEAQDYKANGPADVGFRTGGDNTNIENGVVAAGTKFGVRGIGVAIDSNGSTLTVGVEGEGGIGVRGISRSDAGVFGLSDIGAGVKGSSKTTGVEGIGDTVGVRGESNAMGVIGESPKNGIGVKGNSEGGIGVEGHSSKGSGIHGKSDNSYGGVFTSNFAQMRLEPADLTFGPPTNGSHQKGEFFVDARGALFYCLGGSPARWQQLAGPSLFQNFITAVIKIFTRDR